MWTKLQQKLKERNQTITGRCGGEKTGQDRFVGSQLCVPGSRHWGTLPFRMHHPFLFQQAQAVLPLISIQGQTMQPTKQCWGRIFINRKNVHKNNVEWGEHVSFLPSTDIYWALPTCQIVAYTLRRKVMASAPVKFTVKLPNVRLRSHFSQKKGITGMWRVSHQGKQMKGTCNIFKTRAAPTVACGPPARMSPGSLWQMQILNPCPDLLAGGPRNLF